MNLLTLIFKKILLSAVIIVQLLFFFMGIIGMQISSWLESLALGIDSRGRFCSKYFSIVMTALLAAISLPGCASYYITIQSDPAGATISENNYQIGKDFVRIKYKIPSEYFTGDSIELPRYSLHWMSNYSVDTILVIPKGQRHTKLCLKSPYKEDSIITRNTLKDQIVRELR